MRRLVIEKPFLGFGQGPTGNDFLLGPALLFSPHLLRWDGNGEIAAGVGRLDLDYAAMPNWHAMTPLW